MRAINATIMRKINRKMILNEIRKNPISRAELAEVTQLTRASITQNVEELIAEGIVMEAATVERMRLGRRSTQLVINPNAGVMLGVNLGRLQTDIGAINMRGDVLRHATEPLAGRTVEEMLDVIARTLLNHRTSLEKEGHKVLNVGICAPGPLDPDTGCLLKPPNFDMWHNRKLAETITRRTGLPAFLENVSNAHALAEKYFGVTADAENFVVIRIDEGVGAGIFVRGGLYRGAHNYAAEFGHISVDMNGPECACGNRGCLEQYVSIPALLSGSPYSSWPELLKHRGEAPAEAAMDRLVRYLSHAIISIINAFDVEKVVLAGELALESDELLARLNDEIGRRIIFPVTEPPVVAGASISPVQMGAMPAYVKLWTPGDE